MRFNIEQENSENNSTTSQPSATETTQNIAKFSQSIKGIEEIKAEYKKQRQILLTKFQNELSSVLIDFFKAVPRITQISWSQYTPYFADGDPCEFSMNTIQFKIEDDNFDSYDLKSAGLSSEELEACKTLDRVLSSNEDFFEELLGDHIEVSIDQNGVITTEECGHD